MGIPAQRQGGGYARTRSDSRLWAPIAFFPRSENVPEGRERRKGLAYSLSSPFGPSSGPPPSCTAFWLKKSNDIRAGSGYRVSLLWPI